MANEQNLIRNEDLTPEQRRESASRAGKASAKARRERKMLKDALSAGLSIALQGDSKDELEDLDFADALKDCAAVDKAPKVEGRSLTMFLAGKKQ